MRLTEGSFSDEFILRSMNRCLQDLAPGELLAGPETLIPCESGEYRVSLLTAIPSFQAVHQVRHNGFACSHDLSREAT